MLLTIPAVGSKDPKQSKPTNHMLPLSAGSVSLQQIIRKFGRDPSTLREHDEERLRVGLRVCVLTELDEYKLA